MQSCNLRFAIFVLAAVNFAVPGAHADEAPARYVGVLDRYAELAPHERAAWLTWHFNSRSQPACRVAMDRAAQQDVAAWHRAILDRVHAGEQLSTEGLVTILTEVDNQQNAAVERLADEYRRVTHQAVGDDPWEFQRRMQVWEAIHRMCQRSPYPFESQAKLVGWLQAAILQQRITAVPPLPPTPEFYASDDRGWRATPGQTTPEVKTALILGQRALTAAELAPRIARYNEALDDLASQLYDERVMDVDQLNDVVDHIARLGLVRIGLASDVLALPEADRTGLAAVEPLDTAITLARVKVSASRRSVQRTADHDASDLQWNELAGLGRVSQRLDKLASGPDR